jgi:hypothetical protein
MSATKVNALGFQLKLAENITIGEFYSAMQSHADAEIEVKPTRHVLYVDKKDGYIIGLILTYRNHRRYMEAKRDENGALLVSKLEVEQGANGTEVNVFILNPETCRGILYTYFGSISAGRTWRLFRNIHESVRIEKIERYVRNSGAKTESAITKKRGFARKHYKGDFSLDVLVSESDLDGLLRQFRSFSKVEIRAVEGLTDAPMLSPLRDVTHTANVDLSIDHKAKQSAVKKALKEAFASINPSSIGKTLRLIGADLSGEELSLRLGENRNDYGTHNYDDYVVELPDDKWADFQSCPAISRAIAIVVAYKATFGQPTGSASWISTKGPAPHS